MGSKRYLITGAAGFIGSQMVRFCNEQGIGVVSVDQLSHFEDRPEHRELDFGKRVDREELFSWLVSERPSFDAIIHLGACADTTQLDMEFLLRVNVIYSQKLWTFATEARIPFVYASSAATYGAGELGYSDDEKLISRLKPLNPYGESKRLFDVWVLNEERRSTTPPAWSGFRFFNVYGYGEQHKRKMASVVLHSYDQIRKNGFMNLFRSHNPDYADGHQSRDFIFVEDVVRALQFAATKPIRRGIFNLGTGKARTFLDLTRGVFRALERKEDIRFIDTPEAIRSRYQYFTQAEMGRLRGEGFRDPFTSLEDGVGRYVRELVARSAG